MNGNRFKKLIQAVQTGGPAYAAQKVCLYAKRHLKKERKFSWEDYAFEELSEVMKLDNKFSVSVVVPTYNGGMALENMLQMLKRQKNCGSIEIVVVDSGSTDGTPELCRACGVTLVQIPNEQFSHSGARNLGAVSARGDILVFMTQDALPPSEEWLSEIVAPILAGEADAVSCGEECPEGTDLYYRVASHGHAAFAGFLENDIIGVREKCRDKESLRRNASLSDVSCAIRRELFLRFRHRYNFAEDLDLGIRLLFCGYRTKLLSKTKVIHGHNRNTDYYLKRAVVEQEAFSKIFPQDQKKESSESAASQIFYSACLAAEYLKKLEEIENKEEMEIDKFVKTASELFGTVVRCARHSTKFHGFPGGEAPLLEEVVRLCGQKNGLKKRISSTELAYSMRFYLDNLAEYAAYHGIRTIGELEGKISACLLKQFALCTGMELAKMKNEEIWNQKIPELIKGV